MRLSELYSKYQNNTSSRDPCIALLFFSSSSHSPCSNNHTTELLCRHGCLLPHMDLDCTRPDTDTERYVSFLLQDYFKAIRCTKTRQIRSVSGHVQKERLQHLGTSHQAGHAWKLSTALVSAISHAGPAEVCGVNTAKQRQRDIDSETPTARILRPSPLENHDHRRPPSVPCQEQCNHASWMLVNKVVVSAE